MFVENARKLLRKKKKIIVNFIKIDIEGHEVEAIQGMIGIIEKNQPNLIIEASIDNIFKIKKLLKHINYKVEKINKGPNFIFYK